MSSLYDKDVIISRWLAFKNDKSYEYIKCYTIYSKKEKKRTKVVKIICCLLTATNS